MSTSAQYTIGRLALRAGIPVSTVRYYERSGILRPDGRTEGNYRQYSDKALARLRFILAAKVNGFTLADVKALLDFRDGRTQPCQEVQELIEERLAALEARLQQMNQVRDVLHSSLDHCREQEESGRCRVIDDLSEHSTSAGNPASRKASGD